jgi:thiamine biosynthesis lipoprotein
MSAPATTGFSARVRHAEHVMGTVVSFDVPVSARENGSLAAAVRWLHWVDRVFSPYRAGSDVCLLANAEVTVDACAPEVAEVLAACALIRDLSGGYFTTAPAGRFDPSGYVKGWATERAAALLTAAGSASHLVNAGGDVQCVGSRVHPRARPRTPTPTRAPAPATAPAAATRTQYYTEYATEIAAPEPWRVGIANPFYRNGLALVVAARDCAVATSGVAERGAHIVDPHTGRPASGLASLTVIGPSLSLADAYATAAFAMGPKLARDWTESLDDYEAFAITSAGETWHTAGFTRHICRD